MTEEKGLPEDVADKIGAYVKLKGGRDLLETLSKDENLTKNASASAGIADMALLFDYMDVFNITGKVWISIIAWDGWIGWNGSCIYMYIDVL